MARATKARARVTWNFTVAERIDERSSSAAGIIARLPSDALTRKVAATEFGETFGNRAPQVVYRFLNPWVSPQVSWLFFKARATSISESIRKERATRKIANWPRPKALP